MNISWPKYGISAAACALLKSIALCRLPPATGTPTRVWKYLVSRLQVVLENPELAVRRRKTEVLAGSSRSTMTAPAFLIAWTAASNAAATVAGRADALPREPQARAVQAVRVQERRVVGGKGRPVLSGSGFRCKRGARLPSERDAAGGRIARIRRPAGDRVQRDDRIGDGMSVRPHRVLGVRDGTTPARLTSRSSA